jgi:hypothetical protein
MRRPLGLTLIITFYMIIGGLTLSISFLHLLTINNNAMKLFYLDYCYEIISNNTILTREFLESLPQNTALLVTFTVTFLTSIFYTKLAETLYLGKAFAYRIGTLLHSYAAVSSLALWVLGIDKAKLVGVVFLFINLLKAVYLYHNASASQEMKLEITRANQTVDEMPIDLLLDQQVPSIEIEQEE